MVIFIRKAGHRAPIIAALSMDAKECRPHGK